MMVVGVCSEPPWALCWPSLSLTTSTTYPARDVSSVAILGQHPEITRPTLQMARVECPK